jgi:hypothetical protein
MFVILSRTSGWENESPGQASKNGIKEITIFGGRRLNASVENKHPSGTA